jgi:hypothetical protein
VFVIRIEALIEPPRHKERQEISLVILKDTWQTWQAWRFKKHTHKRHYPSLSLAPKNFLWQGSFLLSAEKV